MKPRYIRPGKRHIRSLRFDGQQKLRRRYQLRNPGCPDIGVRRIHLDSPKTVWVRRIHRSRAVIPPTAYYRLAEKFGQDFVVAVVTGGSALEQDPIAETCHAVDGLSHQRKRTDERPAAAAIK